MACLRLLGGGRNWSTEDLKKAVCEKTGIPAIEQHLLVGTRELRKGEALDGSEDVQVTVVRWPQGEGRVVREMDVKEVQRLIKEGNYNPLEVNKLGQTLVFYAVQHPSLAAEMVALLVDAHGVKIDQQDVYGQTAAHYLAKTDNIACLDFYVRKGGNINHKDNEGQTPMFYAASSGTPRMIRGLFERDADIHVRCSKGRTPICWAKSQENLQALSLCSLAVDRGLLSYTASPDGSVYGVLPAAGMDVTTLAQLENEFLKDHRELLADVLQNPSEAALCKELGLGTKGNDRKKTIKRIAEANAPLQWTLKCVFIPGLSVPSIARKRQVVGYCYCYIKEGGCAISHLKVGRSHQRKGCAMLLIAAAAKRAERILAEGCPEVEKLAGPVARRLNLSVVKQNLPAQSLYEKLGFRSSEVISDSKVHWVKMSRSLPETDDVEDWLGMVPGDSGRVLCAKSALVTGAASASASGTSSATGASASTSSSSSSSKRALPELVPEAPRFRLRARTPATAASASVSVSSAQPDSDSESVALVTTGLTAAFSPQKLLRGTKVVSSGASAKPKQEQSSRAKAAMNKVRQQQRKAAAAASSARIPKRKAPPPAPKSKDKAPAALPKKKAQAPSQRPKR
ncbi:unnamed protein product [Polarella glacialis]|uniref:N-acetyltransferase domain-containing protein n=2 Tax=Polarella glacialis TaxID=89957 RepID=A0A813K7Z0_POLGL|nr:unnamed protein product [Polarella glacialis]